MQVCMCMCPLPVHRCLCGINQVPLCSGIGSVSHSHRCDRLNSQALSEREILSLAAAYVISVPQVSSSFPALACCLPPPVGPYGSTDLMSRQVDVLNQGN
ncbi:hypothetical protein ILYODFUR_012340 [Ilyodon furcidens]|uniref:Uncharacterized protein n=2 Tax=Goodeidae TaxID=28758 RepID=A0ABV0V2G8_9TELE